MDIEGFKIFDGLGFLFVYIGVCWERCKLG